MQLPLLFSFRQVVFGDGFVAGVSMEGRALLDEGGPDGAWISSVAPVGFAGGGADRGIAFTEFRNAWITVLFDIAAESRSFDAFKHACTEFLDATEETVSVEWEAALEQIRKTKYVDPTMRRQPVEAHKIGFEVVDLTHIQPKSENRLEAGVKLAA
jgi:hypothetical protein